MRRFQLSLEQYDSDKIASRYLDRYDPILEPWVEKKIVLLELGVDKGGSLLLWRDYFPLGTIVGIDINLPKDFSLPNIFTFLKAAKLTLDSYHVLPKRLPLTGLISL